MIAVIQSAPGRQPHAGHMKTRDGRRVLFVAKPKLVPVRVPGQAPGAEDVCYARPDGLSSFCVPWRKLVLGYNENPRSNPLGLLPAWKFYPDGIYAHLVDQLGTNKTYILSAGWGLVGASFLLPNYDITLDSDAEPFRQRQPADGFADFCMLPTDSDEDLYFFGDADHVPLFCRLTGSYPGRRIVFYRSAKPPEAPGCQLRKFATADPANWHHECADAFLSARPEPRGDTAQADAAPPKVSNIEARLRAMRELTTASATLPGGVPAPDARALRSAILFAQREIEEFRRLTQSLREIDVTEDEDFQQRFNAFHRILQRSGQWYGAYFRLLETAKVIGAEFVDVLYELWEDTGRYEPAFSSRLVATVDPGKPVWDRFALMHSGLRAPAYVDPDKLDKATNVYRGIREWYADCLESPSGKRIIERYDEQVPEHANVEPLKKLEFVLRHTRMEHRAFAIGGQAGASLPHSA